MSYCVYAAGQGAPNLNPPINVGDTVCVDCPDDGQCKGQQGAASISIQDRAGTKASVILSLQNSSCMDCPQGAKSGYTFAKTGIY